MKYHTTLLEDSIKQFYFYLNIYHPQQLDMIKIAELLKIKIHFAPFSSSTFRGKSLLIHV